ncbi:MULTISPECIES: glycosyltransferase family 2 protein [Haloarcula]|uniref:Dolichol-P-glucose synthetase n=1 Tax=Haloarcula pellucida TaxID=1427151 RepID=A0A830GIV8_9EURY|nr:MULTISPECIES: glycosyltransferase [Halomicroarcula]MBX0348733.1 glycosyltransferase family 2 protein [Halomicroarcula pellucida]MDS0278501.1 glycosyltransferase family 2 protein [Halomicroarcula sp. S1AR25-4]GGN92026.1 dolichol-P-glucose synthetase [Halomicroarcula pellucida]
MSLDAEPPQTAPETPARSTADIVGPDSDAVPTVSVVLPTMNEEEGIAECIERIRNALAALDLTGEIIISDASDDRTPDIAREMGATVVEPDEPGYGYAYRYAFEYARGDYLVMGDADTTYDFEELPKLLSLVRDEGADIAMGSRLDGEIRPGAMPALHQYVGNPLLTKFLNVFYDAGVSDAHSGFRVFTRDALQQLELTTDGMEFASEMIMDAGAKGLDIREVPITYHPREGDAKLDSFRDGWRHVKFMLENAPGYLFSVPGMVMGGVGLAVLVLGFLNLSISGQPIGIHSMIAGSLLSILGFQVGSFGLLSDIATDPIRRPSDPLTTYIRDSFTLERGLVTGSTVFAVGALTASYLIYNWVASDFTRLPSIRMDVLAFTTIVLGIQIVFSSFFMSITSRPADR